jgi:hypothetical protein
MISIRCGQVEISERVKTLTVVVPISVPARILSAIGALATVSLLMLIFVLPGYSSQGEQTSFEGQTLMTAHVSGSATVFAANPGAAPLLIGVAALAAAATSLAIIVAWFRVQQASAVLGLVLLPLSAVAVLSLPSIGLFILPTVTIGWVVVGLRSGAGQRTTT